MNLVLLSGGTIAAQTSIPTSPLCNPIGIKASEWNHIQIQNADGQAIVTFTGFHLKPNPTLAAVDGSVKKITDDNGHAGVEVTYRFDGDEDYRSVRVVAQFISVACGIDVTYRVIGLPEGTSPVDSMLQWSLAPGAEALPAEKLGRWTRHPYGGQPVEQRDGILIRYKVGEQTLNIAFYPEVKLQSAWRDDWSHHAGITANEDGTYETHFSLYLCPGTASVQALVARWHKRPVSLSMSTDKVFNWWTSIPGQTNQLSLHVNIQNTSDTEKTYEMSHWVRDFAGHLVALDKNEVHLKAGEALTRSIAITPSTESIDPERDIFFAEVSVTDLESSYEVFSRTNLTLLPPHQFDSTPQDSIFGLAAYWPFPNEKEAQRVMDRMGVRWLRQYKTQDYKNILSNRHTQIFIHEDWSQEKRDSWIREQLQACIDDGNPAWEFGNEINYTVMSIGMGDVVKDQARTEVIRKYIGWLKDVRRIQKEMGPKAENIKILSFGIAGMDVKFLEEFHDAGGWALIDGIALHPGRGHFTADYPIEQPWNEWTQGAYGSYWNFFGATSKAAQMIEDYGGNKELWLTEVYCPSFPNSFWEDSLRNGAENLVLTFALAETLHVKAVMWYQLYDGVWHDLLGVNPEDREYYFGLIQRDMSFKPALLAYCNIAEQLDGAVFIQWLKFPENSKTRGLLFDTPRGEMAVLWDRTDGYVLTENKENFASPDPWVDTWKSHIPVRFPVEEKTSVTTINVIGQREQVDPDADGYVTLELTGAPLIVYGLNTSGVD